MIVIQTMISLFDGQSPIFRCPDDVTLFGGETSKVKGERTTLAHSIISDGTLVFSQCKSINKYLNLIQTKKERQKQYLE